jgi:hypothetical protein
VIAGAATAGAVLSVVLPGAAPAAYAGWSPTPTAAPTVAPASADATCQGQLASTPAGSNGPPGNTGSDAGGTWTPVLSDVRGPFTVELLQNGAEYAACFTSASFTEVNQISSDGTHGSASGISSVRASGSGSGTPQHAFSGVSISSTASGDLQQVLQNHLTTSTDGPYTLVDGRVGPGISGVTLVRDDGQDVVDSVADGWLIAWWPGSASATSALVTTSSGTTTEPLVLGAAPPPPPGLPSSGGGETNVSGSGNMGSSGNSGSSGNTGNSGSGGPVTNSAP